MTYYLKLEDIKTIEIDRDKKNSLIYDIDSIPTFFHGIHPTTGDEIISYTDATFWVTDIWWIDRDNPKAPKEIVITTNDGTEHVFYSSGGDYGIHEPDITEDYMREVICKWDTEKDDLDYKAMAEHIKEDIRKLNLLG